VADARALRIGAPEVATFPFALWDRLARQCQAAQRQAQAQYLDPAGLPALREAIAQWLLVSRGVRCQAGQVVVTSGSQQAIDLVGRLLLDAGDEAIVEDPGYPGIRASLAGHGAQVRPAAVDGQGLDIDAGAAAWPAARLAVVTPTHQFPLGVHMGLARRLALIDWARRTDAWIVEDDYDGEFQYGPHRTPALCSLPHGGACCTSAPSPRACTRGCGWAFWCCPPRWCRPSPAPRPCATATARAMPRRCWPASSPRATCCGTCAACASCTGRARAC
jgi:GntR family transcriptional regulator/MocR family aminotransferase